MFPPLILIYTLYHIVSSKIPEILCEYKLKKDDLTLEIEMKSPLLFSFFFLQFLDQLFHL